MTNQSSLCFYFPYHEDSGVPVLFYRMANEIAEKHRELTVYAVDYEDGAMARHLLPLPNLHLIPFYDGAAVKVPEDAILIMQSFLPCRWPIAAAGLRPYQNTRIFFWNLHSRNLVPNLLPFLFLTSLPANYWPVYRFASLLYPVFMRRLTRFGELLFARSAISFMDGPSFEDTCRYLYLKNKKADYIPIPVTYKTRVTQSEAIDRRRLRFCWIGRLCDFKWNPLVYTVNKAGEAAKQLGIKITYYIVGDGPNKKDIERNIKPNDNMDVIFCGALPHEKLEEFLLENVDILTAMGTSALEGCPLFIPVIPVDASYKKIKGDCKYRMLYESENYELGHIITKKDYVPGNESLKQIVENIINNYQAEGEKTYRYFIENHTIESVVDKFMSRVFQTTLTYGMIDKSYFKKSWALAIHDALHPLYERIIGRKSSS